MKKSFWKTDWFMALIVSIVFLGAGRAGLMDGLERKLYDMGVQLASRTPSDKVVVVAIDDESIAKMGRWPWSRTVIADMFDQLTKAQAKVIGNTILFTEPQTDPGFAAIKEVNEFYKKSALGRDLSELDALLQKAKGAVKLESKSPSFELLKEVVKLLYSSNLADTLPQDVAELRKLLTNAEKQLNTDIALANSIQKAQNIVQTMNFKLGSVQGRPDKDLPPYIVANAVNKKNIKDEMGARSEGYTPLPAQSLTPPLELFAKQANRLGHVNVFPDVDGAIRSELLMVDYYNTYFPSLSIQLAAASLNLKAQDIKINLGESVSVGKLNIVTGPNSEMYTFYYRDEGDKAAFPVYPFYDVKEGKISAANFKDKIVILGATATGVGTAYVTPVDSGMAPALMVAHSVSSILQEDFFVTPSWGVWVQLLVVVLVALYLILLLPRLKAGMGALATAITFVVLLGGHLYLMSVQTTWLQLALPMTLLVFGHLILTTKRFLMTEKGKIKADADSAENNKMLGFAYQEKGQLDLAFEKFRKAPVDESIMEALYNLALDFERKRQFNKAASVFTYIAEYNAKFRDIEQRIERNKQLEKTVILGGSSGAAGGTLVLGGEGIEKPMLGRYQVEKELGKGAMGIVYLGKDPTINRVVAIKTMALSQEFDGDELKEVKARFFREAETAGRLTHPHIVTIYDAGEEHDLAYISMEFLKGEDLVQHTKPGKLLSVTAVIDIVIKVADALDYAHKQMVVHRDIKPANIMYDAASNSVKVTDFGIARITDSSRTKTGMVLGTPSYMSPEQLAGKRVDGRSDLFSLGVTLYQLCTGQLPFIGESMATLMYKIANEKHQDVLLLRSDLPACLKGVIDKVLEKNSDKRYQTGAELVYDLQACLKQAQAGV